MKKSFNLLALLLPVAMLLVGCQQEVGPEGGLDAKITSISITNAGLSGGDIVNGMVDNENFTVTFEGVPAETNIAAVKFGAKLSIGASLEKDVIDFTQGAEPDATELKGELKVINFVLDKKGNESGRVEQVYTVTLTLKPAENAPLLDKLVIKDADGNESTVTSQNIVEGMYDGILCLGIPESATAEIVSVSVIPARATYTFTTAQNGVISASDPGMLVIEFMGLRSEYMLSFAASPKPGADWSKAVVHDFSINTSVYVDLAEEFTRGGDFDGEYVLLANRTAPKLFRVEDLMNDNTGNPIALDMTGVEGGTHIVSAGRLAQGHVYLCNLSVGCSETEPLKVYHYATPASKPEVVLQWDGKGLPLPDDQDSDDFPEGYFYSGRIGDNISISLDESGNGYAYFFKQEADQKFFRFTVTNFTEFGGLVEMELPAVSNYYGMMNAVGLDQYLFTSSYKEMLWLMDHDANILRSVNCLGTPIAHACDPRVIEFNRARYLMLSNARRFNWWKPEGVNVYDISEGNDLVAALVKLQEHFDYDPDDPEEGVTPIEPCYNFTMDSGDLASACVALCNCAVVNGKLLIFTAAPKSGFALIEVPAAF